MAITINSTTYQIEHEFTTDSIQDSLPNLYKYNTAREIVRTLYIRRPNGRKQFIVTEHTNGRFSNLTPIY